MLLFWLAGLFLTAITPLIIVAVAGFAVSCLAGQADARQQGQQYPTVQMLALTYQEPPEQWPPAPIIEAPWI